MARRYATSAEVAALTGLADDAALQSVVDRAKHHVSLEAWGIKASDGHLLVAAHFATVYLDPSSSAAQSGNVASRSIGSISVSYAVAASDDPLFGTTKYGREFLALKRGIIVAPVCGRYP